MHHVLRVAKLLHERIDDVRRHLHVVGFFRYSVAKAEARYAGRNDMERLHVLIASWWS